MKKKPDCTATSTDAAAPVTAAEPGPQAEIMNMQTQRQLGVEGENANSVPAAAPKPSMPSPKKTQNYGSDSGFIAYVHRLSPPNKNRQRTMQYQMLVLQTQDANVDALLYASKKRPLLEDSFSGRSAIKSQRYMKTPDSKKLVVNEMTKISTPKQGEYSFHFQTPKVKYLTIQEIIDTRQEWDTVSFITKAFHVGEVSVVGGEKLQLAECTFSDQTAAIQVDIWEKHIPMVTNGKVYAMQYLHVWEWSGIKKVSTTTDSVISESANEDLEVASVRKEDLLSDSQVIVNVPDIAYVSNIIN